MIMDGTSAVSGGFVGLAVAFFLVYFFAVSL